MVASPDAILAVVGMGMKSMDPGVWALCNSSIYRDTGFVSEVEYPVAMTMN